MIYLVCATQLVTVLCGLTAVRWCIAYVIDRDNRQDRVYGDLIAQYTDILVKERVEAYNRLQEILAQSVKERELLIERIQHPEVTKGQAAGVDGTSSVAYIDEEEEARLDQEYEEDEDPISVPIQPVKPINLRGENHGSTEE